MNLIGTSRFGRCQPSKKPDQLRRSFTCAWSGGISGSAAPREMSIALGVLLVVSPLLKAPFYKVVFLAQVIFYALSLISLARLAKGGILARIADAAGTFVLLNGAAVVALANFISGKRAAWR